MTQPPATPYQSPAIAEIERLNLKYRREEQYQLSRLSEERRVQVREGTHYAPPAMVNRYAETMKYSPFPPIVVTSDGHIVDGNTRIKAAQKLKRPDFPAIVLELEREPKEGGLVATKNAQRILDLLAMTLNDLNGKDLTPRERRADAKNLLAEGVDPKEIARSSGLPLSTLGSLRREIAAEERFEKIGFSTNGMSEPYKRALGAAPPLQLNDEPYRALVDLTLAAGLTASEVSQIARDAKATGSDVAALDALHTVRAEMAARITEHQVTGASRPPAARQLRQHLGYVLKFAEDAAALVETARGDVAEAHVDALRSAVAVLTNVLRLQEAAAAGD